jgi:hypothetical protein
MLGKLRESSLFATSELSLGEMPFGREDESEVPISVLSTSSTLVSASKDAVIEGVRPRK